VKVRDIFSISFAVRNLQLSIVKLQLPASNFLNRRRRWLPLHCWAV